MVWETIKAFLRGLAISYAAKQKKERANKFRILQEKLKKEESNLMHNPSAKQINVKITYIQHQINKILMEELEKKIKLTRQAYFENANKPGRWLAYKLRREKAKTWINTVRDETYQERYAHEEIESITKKFYDQLYSKKEATLEDQKIYLEKYGMKQLNEEQRKILNDHISLFELIEAVKRQKRGKTPGPDGIPSEYYKTCEESILIPFKQLVEEIRETNKLLDTWKEATITLIHKEGTEAKEIKNDRPISLLNTDYKILYIGRKAKENPGPDNSP